MCARVFSQLFVWLSDTYPNTRFGLVGATRDEILRIFFGFGNDDCAEVSGLPNLGAEALTEALTDLQSEVLKGRVAEFLAGDDNPADVAP